MVLVTGHNGNIYAVIWFLLSNYQLLLFPFLNVAMILSFNIELLGGLLLCS